MLVYQRVSNLTHYTSLYSNYNFIYEHKQKKPLDPAVASWELCGFDPGTSMPSELYGGFLSHRGTPSHPFEIGIVHETKHPARGVPLQETPI